MKKFITLSLTLVTLLILVNCEEVGKKDLTKAKLSATKWELTEVMVAGTWHAVPDNVRETYTFLNEDEVEYTSSSVSCAGSFALEEGHYVNTDPKTLNLKVPCVSQSNALWWGLTIESRTDKYIIAKPRFNPSSLALMAFQAFKYKVLPANE